jgi:hypothetical protein
MAVTARKLITDAYYISGVVSQEQQEVSGPEIKIGLRIFNDALAVEAITGTLIPFYKEHVFNFIAGQEKYEIDNLIEIENAVFLLNSVRYSMRPVRRNDYFGRSRVEGITTFPTTYHFERAENKGELYVFFPPNGNYECRLWGKFGLEEVENEDVNLSAIYAREYLTYLKFLLAKYICAAYDEVLGEQSQLILDEIVKGLHYESPIDVSIHKVSVFGKQYMLDYTTANLFNGWWPQ